MLLVERTRGVASLGTGQRPRPKFKFGLGKARAWFGKVRLSFFSGLASLNQHFSLKKLWNVNTLSLGLNWRLGRSNVGLKISGSIRLNSKNWSHSTSIENIHRLRGFAGKFWNRLHLVSWQIYHQWHYVGSHSFSRTKVFRTEFAKLRLEGLAPKISAKYLRKKRRDEFEANLFLKNKDWLISKKKRFWKKR